MIINHKRVILQAENVVFLPSFYMGEAIKQ